MVDGSHSATATGSSLTSAFTHLALCHGEPLAGIRICQSALQIIVGLLLKSFSILESIDKLELLSLHPPHLSLVCCLVPGVTIQLTLYLLANAITSIHLIKLTLVSRLLFLSCNHELSLAGTLLLSSLLLQISHPKCIFVIFWLIGLLLGSLHLLLLAIGNLLVYHIFVSFIVLSYHFFLHLNLSHPILLLLLVHDIALALWDNLVSSFTSFVYFLDDFALFHLKQADTIAKQF